MFCVVAYDIATENNDDLRRLEKVFEICRKYFEHVELSVFYGDINKRKLFNFIKEINKVIDQNRDSVIIYVFRDRSYIKQIIRVGIKEFKEIL